MKLKLEIYSCLCETEEFVINGINANSYDFGIKEDISKDTAEDYCCGNMVFRRIPSTKEILEKYKITESEYSDICYKLEDGLSFGSCGYCS